MAIHGASVMVPYPSEPPTLTATRVLYGSGARPVCPHEAAGTLGVLYGCLVAASIGDNRQYVGEDIHDALEIYRFI